MKRYLKIVVSCNQQLLSAANQAKMIWMSFYLKCIFKKII